MLRIRPAQHVAGIFDDRVLKTTAGAQEWAFLLAGKTNRPQCAVGITVGAGGHAPEAVEGMQFGGRGDRVGLQPVQLHVQAQGVGSLLQRHGDGLVGRYVGVVITDQGEVQRGGFHCVLPMACGVLRRTIDWRSRNQNWRLPTCSMQPRTISSITRTCR